MILLNRERLDQWLQTIGRNPAWLAKTLGYSRSYISLIMSNRAKVSSHFIKQIMLISHMQFETLFYVTREDDDRLFFGSEIFFQGRMVEGKQYYAMLDRMKQKLVVDNKKMGV